MGIVGLLRPAIGDDRCCASSGSYLLGHLLDTSKAQRLVHPIPDGIGQYRMALGAHRLAEQATGQGQGVTPHPPPALGTGDKVAVSGGLVSQCPMHKPSRAGLSIDLHNV
eukprot:scaffold3831_cov148-Skeletonema_marinoi.AAC.2